MFFLDFVFFSQGRVDPGAIRLQELTAKAGAVFAMATVCLLVGLIVKNTVYLGE